MTEGLDIRLPEDVLAAFDGSDLESKMGLAYLLVTVDSDRSPRICMLSAGEVLAQDERTFRLALWPGTRTGENLRRGGEVLFCYVAPGRVLYIRGIGRSLEGGTDETAQFAIAIRSVESDEHQGMPVSSPIRFETHQSQADVVQAWAAKLAGLRSS
jgi:hypothetical protein